MANAANLINFGAGGGTAVGDVVYSAYPLTAPSYLPLTDDTAAYLTSSYPALGAIYAPTAVAYTTASTTIPRPASTTPYSFVFGNDIFMGWTALGNIITSADTINWTPSVINTDYIQQPTVRVTSPSPASNAIYAIASAFNWQGMAYGNGRFVAIRNAPAVAGAANTESVSQYSIGATAASQDNGETWVQGSLPNFGGTSNVKVFWNSIGFGGGRFVASGYADYDGANFRVAMSYSADGVNWTTPTYRLVPTSSAGITQINTIAFGNGVYVTVSSDNSAANTYGWYTTGTESLTWNQSSLSTGQKWKSIAFGAGLFVAVGSGYNDADTNIACSSANGISWTNRTLPASLNWTSVTYANGYFVAVARLVGTNAVATSPDGINWTLRATTSGTSRGPIAGGNGKFIYQDYVSAAGTNSATVISLDTAASTFTLPISARMKGMIPYIKAT